VEVIPSIWKEGIKRDLPFLHFTFSSPNRKSEALISFQACVDSGNEELGQWENPSGDEHLESGKRPSRVFSVIITKRQWEGDKALDADLVFINT